MKLNEKCIDDILLFLEGVTGVEKGDNDRFQFKRVTDQSVLNAPVLTEKYSEEEIYYSLLKINELGFATIKFSGAGYIIIIEDVKLNGHIRLQQIHCRLDKPTEQP